MSTENAARKKRTTSETTPIPDGDHRKRRRNRTTQSCLNCHTSKRMCDRKRPACARCTQLGLTGLCVYEVDDPSQRPETQDESTRLLKRVAELEGVIRELKNKPNPRWVQSGSSGDEFEKWHPHPGGGNLESCSSNAPSPPVSSSDSSDNGNSSGRSSVAPAIRLQSTSHSRRMRSPYSPGSPMSGSSPGLATPTDDYPYSPIAIAGHSSMQDYDLASMFLNYPGLMSGPDNGFSSLSEIRFNKQTSNHCGCIQDQNNYNTMLELSLRLRKATDVLGRSPSHQLGGFCQLHQRIAELDSFTTNALSDNTPNLSDRKHPNIQGTFPNSQLYSQRISPSSRAMQSGPWSLLASNSSPPPSLDDSFMTWEPQRRA